jgi:hypothetical protein
VEAEAPVKKQRGRRPGSGYVKDRWYYVPFWLHEAASEQEESIH